MNWKLKAHIQNAVSLLPSKLSYNTHYFIQRHFGSLKNKPISCMQAGITIARRIQEQNRPIAHKTFLEVGTGRRLHLPIALWLCGASQITTVDLNPYLKLELILDDLAYIRDNHRNITELFGVNAEQSLFKERLNQLTCWTGHSITDLLDVMNIRYLAPSDATRLDLASQSFDYHVSYTVLEHISPEVLVRILIEGKRILGEGGLFVHCIDLSDHFAHADRAISSVNFLRFSESEWSRWAGNRYMYHNRLRIDELLNLLNKSGLRILAVDKKVDSSAREIIEKGFLPLDKRFQSKSAEVNATISVCVVAM